MLHAHIIIDVTDFLVLKYINFSLISVCGAQATLFIY